MTAQHTEETRSELELPEPQDPRVSRPDPQSWPSLYQEAAKSDEMRMFRECLLTDGVTDVRESILTELADHYGIATDEARRRCLNARRLGVQEWEAANATSGEEGLREFYRHNEWMAYSILWYRYIEAEGYVWPSTVVAARALPRPGDGRRHLDFGSGVGVMSQVMHKLGYEIDLADVSTSLLKFALHRLERRGVAARYIDLNDEALEHDRYDVVTAIDTLAHVPDVQQTAEMLHAAMRPGSLIIANFDTRQRVAETAWHLYEDDLPLRYTFQRVGFEPVQRLGGKNLTVYRRVEPSGVAHAIRGLRDLILLRTPLRRIVREARWRARKMLRRG